MGVYKYKACDAQGKIFKDIMEADSEQEFLLKLKEAGLRCIDFSNATGEKSQIKAPGKLRDQELSDFCRQLSMLLSSGMTTNTALDVLVDTASGKILKGVYVDVNENVKKNNSLSSAMGKRSDVFPAMLINMVKSGEEKGNLSETMSMMAKHYDTESRLRRKIRAATAYPVILLLITLVSIFFITIAVMPRFVTLFGDMELPGATKFVIGLSNILTKHWFPVLLVIVVLLVAVVFLLSKASVRFELDKMKCRLPYIGEAWRTIYTAKFATAFYLLYQSSKNIPSSFENALDSINNLYVHLKLKDVSERIHKGESLSKSLQANQVLAPLFSGMLAKGENTDSFEKVLASAASHFQEEADNGMGKLIGLIEPAMLILMALIIGLFVIAIALPVINMYVLTS